MLWVRSGGLPGRNTGFLGIDGFLATVGLLVMKGSLS